MRWSEVVSLLCPSFSFRVLFACLQVFFFPWSGSRLAYHTDSFSNHNWIGSCPHRAVLRHFHQEGQSVSRFFCAQFVDTAGLSLVFSPRSFRFLRNHFGYVSRCNSILPHLSSLSTNRRIGRLLEKAFSCSSRMLPGVSPCQKSGYMRVNALPLFIVAVLPVA